MVQERDILRTNKQSTSPHLTQIFLLVASEPGQSTAFNRATTVWIATALLAFALSATASIFHQGLGHRSLILIPTLLITAAVYRLSATHSFTRIFPLLVLVYVATTLDYMHGSYSPRGDSYVFHVPAFLQVAEGFAQGDGFSEWLPAAGGVRTGFSHIHLGVALPHRMLGYLLYSITPLSAIVAYKITFALGVILIGLGWGLCLERMTRSTRGASLGSLAIMLGGTGTGFHQEQILFTMIYMPWILLALIEIRQDRRWFVVLAGLTGLAATAHFPHIYLITLTLLVLVTLLASPGSIKSRIFFPSASQWITSTVLFCAAALPLVYIVAHMDGLLSWHRPNLTAISYENYLETLGRQYKLSDMLQYLRPTTDLFLDDLDISGFYAGEVTVLFAIIATVFAFRAAWPIASFTLIVALLTIGTCDVIGILYFIASPIIKSFREWYHFFPLVNFGLAALAAIGIARCVQQIERMRHRGYGKLSYVLAGIFILGIYQLAYIVFPYSRGHYLIEHENKITNEDFLKYSHDPSILQYRARLILDRTETASPGVPALGMHDGTRSPSRPRTQDVDLLRRPGPPCGLRPQWLYASRGSATRDYAPALRSPWRAAIDKDASPLAMDNPRSVFVASTVKYGIVSADDQIDAYLASGPARNFAVVGITPSDHPEIGAGNPPASSNSKFLLRTHGIDIETESTKAGLLVTPMNYDLGLTATRNGAPATVLRVNGALAGIPIPPGKSSISLRVQSDAYPWIFYIHALVELFVTVMIIYLLIQAHRLRPRES